MRLASFRVSGIGIAAAIGGGLATAVLSALTLQHPPLTLVMGFIAPLPLMIAGVGFGPLAGGLAVLVGSIFVGLFDIKLGHVVMTGFRSPGAAGIDVVVFLVGFGVPCWLLSMLARRQPAPTTTTRARPEERKLGMILVVAVAFAALAVAAMFISAIVANGGLAAFDKLLTDSFEKIWKQVAETRPLPKGVDVRQFAVELNLLVPALMSAFAVAFYVCNLWLAARIAQTSDLLGAPWPDIPHHLRVPRLAALLLAVSLGLSFTGGFVGLVSRIVSAAIGAALALQGLAVIHGMTRGRGSRLAILIIVYLSLAALMPWPLVFWAAIGLLDTAFSFRDRQKPIVIQKS